MTTYRVIILVYRIGIKMYFQYIGLDWFGIASVYYCCIGTSLHTTRHTAIGSHTTYNSHTR